MEFLCNITAEKNDEKDIINSFRFTIKGINDITIVSNKAVPTIIYKTLEYILDSNIPENIDKYPYDSLTISVLGKGISVSFDLKGKIKH